MNAENTETKPALKLILRLFILTCMMLGVVLVQFYGDRQDWHLPWYFIHELTLIGIPMIWLLFEALKGAPRATIMAFIVTSAIFITLGSIFELVAIQNRYWWFYQDLDRLTGLSIGAVPLEEFIYYPLILNIPVLFYIYLERRYDKFKHPDHNWMTTRLKQVFYLLSGLFVIGGVALIILSFNNTTPVLDYSIVPQADESGALRYNAGPKKWGWTIVQLISTGVALILFVKLRQKLIPQALVILVALFIPYALYLELMACGRGWWVWNNQQVIGIFTWVIPIDSYLMYLTGALLPTLVYIAVKPFFLRTE